METNTRIGQDSILKDPLPRTQLQAVEIPLTSSEDTAQQDWCGCLIRYCVGDASQLVSRTFLGAFLASVELGFLWGGRKRAPRRPTSLEWSMSFGYHSSE